MNNSLLYLSASRIRTYLTCPMKYRLTYIDQTPWAFTPAALVLGTSVHAAVEAFYRERMAGATLSPADLKDVFNDTWTAATDTDTPLDTDDPDALRAQGHTLLDMFAENAAPRTILAVEESFRLPLIATDTGEVLDIDLVGRMDMVETDNGADGPDGSDGIPVIVDLKTLARKPSDTDLQHDLQLMAYAYAARRSGLVDDHDDVLLRLDVLTKTKRPAFSQHFVVRTPDTDHRFFLLARDVIHAIRAGAFPPSPGWQCGGCPVGHFCPFESLSPNCCHRSGRKKSQQETT